VGVVYCNKNTRLRKAKSLYFYKNEQEKAVAHCHAKSCTCTSFVIAFKEENGSCLHVAVYISKYLGLSENVNPGFGRREYFGIKVFFKAGIVFV
jgi:hypothetical protein